MSQKISFAEDIAALKAALLREQEELARLEDLRKDFAVQTREARQALERLRKTLSGEFVDSNPRRSARGPMLEPLEVSPESGRPSRGARREQIEALCRHFGRGGAKFKTKDVLRELTAVEGDLSPGIRSYVYAVMNTFEEDGLIVKVGRGSWTLS
jgi:hypothetical protein